MILMLASLLEGETWG